MRSTAVLSLLAVTGLSLAQEQYHIDPSSVDQSTRDTWCDNQKTQCPLICLQLPNVTSSNTISNDCDPDTLTYNCVCENNVAPNVTEYSQTLPFYICQEWGNQCVAACNNDNTCANACRANHPCGAQEPKRVNSTTMTTMSATAATSRAAATGFGGAAATTGAGGKGGASAVLNLGQSYSLAVVTAGIFAGFAILL